MGCIQGDTRSSDYSSLANLHACTLQNFPVHPRGLRNLLGQLCFRDLVILGGQWGLDFEKWLSDVEVSQNWGGTIMGVPMRRIIVYQGLYCGSLMLGKYDIPPTCAAQDRQNSRVRSKRLRGLWAQCVRAARCES